MTTTATPGDTPIAERFASLLTDVLDDPAPSGESEQVAEGDQAEGAEGEQDPEGQQPVDEESEDAEEAQPQSRTIRLPDGREIPEEEAAKGYLRTEDYTRKRQAEAAQARIVEAEQQRILKERDQVADTFRQLEAAMAAMSPTEPDWEKVRAERPETFPDEYAEFQIQQARLKKMTELRTNAEQAANAERMNAFKGHLAREAEVLLEKIPEWRDPAKKKADGQQIKEYATSLGFTVEQLNSGLTDHRMVMLVRDAARYHALKAKTGKPAGTKPVPAVVLKPGAAQSNKTPVSDVTRAKQRLAKTGRQEDAASVFLRSGLLD